MANDLAKLTAAALTMLGTEAFANVQNNSTSDSNTSRDSSIELILPAEQVQGLKPGDLVAGPDGRVLFHVNPDIEAGSTTCNICGNSPCNCPCN
jgi:hypothetical protein